MDKQRMLHRTVLEIRGVEIPEGYEVDHLCQNRGCCNPEHLEVKPRKTHLEETNRNRYALRKAAALAYWKETGCTGVALSEKYGVSFSTSCRWIRGASTEAD